MAGLLARGSKLCPPSRPVSGQWRLGIALRSQLRGQPRFWSLLGTPHRVPISSARAVAWAEPSSVFVSNLEKFCKVFCDFWTAYVTLPLAL
jgi:hypothetical protein